MFSQLFIILIAAALIYSGVADAEPLHIVLGALLLLNACFTLYQLTSGKVLTRHGFKASAAE